MNITEATLLADARLPGPRSHVSRHIKGAEFEMRIDGALLHITHIASGDSRVVPLSSVLIGTPALVAKPKK